MITMQYVPHQDCIKVLWSSLISTNCLQLLSFKWCMVALQYFLTQVYEVSLSRNKEILSLFLSNYCIANRTLTWVYIWYYDKINFILNTVSQYCDSYIKRSHWVEWEKWTVNLITLPLIVTSLPNALVFPQEKIDAEYLIATGLMNWFISMSIHQCSCGIKF